MQPMRFLTPAVSSAFAPLHQSDGWGYRVLAAGWWLFIAAFFLAPDKHALRMTFYVAVVVPALIWSHRIVREIDWRDPLWLSILATLVFLSASAFWGADRADEHALRAMKIMVFLVLCFLVPRFLAGAGLLTIRHLLGAILALAAFIPVIGFFVPVLLGLSFVHYLLSALRSLREAGA
jgi:hypothetical protein